MTSFEIPATFWTSELLTLPAAVKYGVEDWASIDKQSAYRLTARVDPYEGIPSYDFAHDMPATIPDPEYIDVDGAISNIGPYSISKIPLTEHYLFKNPMIRKKGVKAPTLTESTLYCIDESEKAIKVIENFKGPVRNANEVDYNEVLVSLSSLKRVLDSLT